MTQHTAPNGRSWPACVGVEEASRIFGWPLYFFPVLMRAGHLKPLGKPMQNARKWVRYFSCVGIFPHLGHGSIGEGRLNISEYSSQ